MPSNSPAITIVIPNYNGKNLLAKNLPSVCKAAEFYSGTANIIVVDDGSSEMGTEKIVSEFEPIIYLRHEVNLGFSAAVLTGVRSAKTEMIFLLNSDVSPSIDSIKHLVTPFKSDTIFATSPLIYNEDGTPNIYSWNQYHWKGLKLVRKKWDLDQLNLTENTEPIPHLFCSGGSAMIRRSMFLSLGGFSDIYKPYYSEDLDISVRAWRKGWQSLFTPQSSVIHQEEGAIKSQEKVSFVKTIQRRNSFYFEWSHFSIFRLFFFRSIYWLKQVIIRSLKNDRVYLKGLYLAMKNIRPAIRHRLSIDKASSVSFENILTRLEGDTLNSDA